MKRSEGGVSVFEWLVLAVTGAAASACLMPATQAARIAANAVADRAQLRTHYVWLQAYKSKHQGGLPSEGGYRFVLSTWASKLFEHTPENLDRFVSPGARDNDPDYRRAREMLVKGEDPWPDLAAVTSVDTHYVGRARRFLRTAEAGPGQAWMATDNEGAWVFPDGSINVLRADGSVRGYSHDDLRAQFGVGALDRDQPVCTFGSDSPIPECQKLDN